MSEKTKENNKNNVRYRRWCFTSFNVTDYPTKDDLANAICKSEVKYLIIGLEHTKADKPHYQGYVEYKNGKTFNSIKKSFPDMHIYQAKGTCNDNIAYCSKTDTEPLQRGYANVSDSQLSKGDIASNLIDFYMSADVNNWPKLYNVIRDFSDFGDYIIHNYKAIQAIIADIYSDKLQAVKESNHFRFHPAQEKMYNIEVLPPNDMPF